MLLLLGETAFFQHGTNLCLELGFTAALLDLCDEVGVGRSTLFDWMNSGTPLRRQRAVGRFYEYAVRYGIKTTADHKAVVFL